MTAPDMADFVDQYHRALDAFFRGDPAPAKGSTPIGETSASLIHSGRSRSAGSRSKKRWSERRRITQTAARGGSTRS